MTLRWKHHRTEVLIAIIGGGVAGGLGSIFGPIGAITFGILGGSMSAGATIMVRYLYRVLTDRGIYGSLMRAVSGNGIYVKQGDYNSILVDVAKLVNGKFYAVCTIRPSEFMQTERYLEVQKQKRGISDKVRILVLKKETLQQDEDSDIIEFVKFNLEKANFHLYWLDPLKFSRIYNFQFGSKQLPITPADLVILDKRIINGTSCYIESEKGYKLEYTRDPYHLENYEEFFRVLLAPSNAKGIKESDDLLQIKKDC